MMYGHRASAASQSESKLSWGEQLIRKFKMLKTQVLARDRMTSREEEEKKKMRKEKILLTSC